MVPAASVKKSMTLSSVARALGPAEGAGRFGESVADLDSGGSEAWLSIVS